MTIHTMLYSRYKNNYSDCETVPGTYNKVNKTIDVLIPEGRMKPSGVRGERFKTIYLMVANEEGKWFRAGFRAISYTNAVKQAKKCFNFVEE